MPSVRLKLAVRPSSAPSFPEPCTDAALIVEKGFVMARVAAATVAVLAYIAASMAINAKCWQQECFEAVIIIVAVEHAMPVVALQLSTANAEATASYFGCLFVSQATV